MTRARWTFAPATPERWRDLEALFGPRGACGGCWCMWLRRSAAEFERNKGAGNKAALRALVRSGPAPGILAYDGEIPVGWCAVAPREDYPRLERSRTLARLDDTPVWSVTCFFVAREYRRRGLTTALLRAAVRFARTRGARIVEGYPNDTAGRSLPDAFAWHGVVPTFERAGFIEVLRRSASRPIMRTPVGRRARAARR